MTIPFSGKDALPTLDEPLRLIQAIQSFSKARVLILGDVMVDEYLTGDAERISPEAPVPVVRIENEKQLVGGAGNVARNVTSLGGNAVIVGVRGRDIAGEIVERRFSEDGIDHALLCLPERPTTIKTRILARQQQVLRFDREVSSPLSTAENSAVLELAEKYIPHCDALILSDYGKGLISENIVSGIHRLIAKTGRTLPVLVDPKPQNFSFYKGVTMLTPNAKETSDATHLPVKTPQDIILAGQRIIESLQCQHLVTTLGSRGMAVFENAHCVWHIPTVALQVFDVTGAGDTVIATISLALAAGLSLTSACLLANYAAGIVVGEVGAATASPRQLTAAMNALPKPDIVKWL